MVKYLLMALKDYIYFNPNEGNVWKPCQVQGGVAATPPIYLGSGATFGPKIKFPYKQASIPTHLADFQNFFFQNSQKNWRKLKTYQKLLKMSENSKFCNFWAISTCNTSKESIFLIEFNFTQKKYDLFEKKLKKIKFFRFFCQDQFWPLVFDCIFLKFVPKNFKTEFICALEGFWN